MSLGANLYVFFLTTPIFEGVLLKIYMFFVNEPPKWDLVWLNVSNLNFLLRV